MLTVGLAVAMFVVASANANTPVPHAAFTTTNTNVDGTGHCQNGNEAVNCNIYDGKDFVWLNGGPVQGQLDDGMYFFDVLVPGGQGGGADPNDGTTKNLSDLSPTSNTGAGDAWSCRVFSISSHVITYPVAGYSDTCAHDFDSNEIRLMPYDDTTNPGGVYIMAICSLDGATDAVLPTQTANPPGVDPSLCKYDAFKVNGENILPPASELGISKGADGSYTNSYKWHIKKEVDKTSVTLNGAGSAVFTYTVTVNHDAAATSAVKVNGTITVLNDNLDSSLNTLPVDITGVTDQLSGGTDCTVTGGGAQTLTLAATDFAYQCDLGDTLPSGQLDNTATVTWGPQLLDDGSLLLGGSKSFTFNNILFAASDSIDECVDVSDPIIPLSPHHYCVGDAGDPSFSFQYTRTVTFNPAYVPTCRNYDNTATFTTNDTSTTGTGSQRVTVCFYNAALTPGYWKNHLTYDSKHPNDPYTAKYLPKSLGNYAVSSTALATAVFNAMNCNNTGSVSQLNQNAIGCLAGHLLAAKLNVANGANPCITTVIGLADTFLIGIPYTGPTGNYTAIGTVKRNQAITYKNAFDKYNNGGGC